MAGEEPSKILCCFNVGAWECVLCFRLPLPPFFLLVFRVRSVWTVRFQFCLRSRAWPAAAAFVDEYEVHSCVLYVQFTKIKIHFIHNHKLGQASSSTGNLNWKSGKKRPPHCIGYSGLQIEITLEPNWVLLGCPSVVSVIGRGDQEAESCHVKIKNQAELPFVSSPKIPAFRPILSLARSQDCRYAPSQQARSSTPAGSGQCSVQFHTVKSLLCFYDVALWLGYTGLSLWWRRSASLRVESNIRRTPFHF